MIRIKRRIDNAIMNDRQSSDWPKYGKLETMKAERDTLPKNTAPDVIERIEVGIKGLLAERDTWYAKRVDHVCAMFGGWPADYVVERVPKDEEQAFLTARYIEIVENQTVYHMDAKYEIDESVVAIYPTWVNGNERLTETDITDLSVFAGNVTFWRFNYAKNPATQNIFVMLFIRAEDEEFAPFPVSLLDYGVVCQGRIDIDGTITEGEF